MNAMKKIAAAVCASLVLSAPAIAKDHVFIVMDVANTSYAMKNPEQNRMLNKFALSKIMEEIDEEEVSIILTSDPYSMIFSGNEDQFKGKQVKAVYDSLSNKERLCSDLGLTYAKINNAISKLKDGDTAKVIAVSPHINVPFPCKSEQKISIPQDIDDNSPLKEIANNEQVKSILHLRLEPDQDIPLSKFYREAGKDLLKNKVEFVEVNSTMAKLQDDNYRLLGGNQ